MIAIIDYGAGNLRSIQRALVHHGAETVVTDDPATVREAEAIVFPGVGNARAAMERLNASGMSATIVRAVENGTPLLGICLGMQLLYGDQEEGPTTGLGLLAGRGVALPSDRKSPHMGWNTVAFREDGPMGHLPHDRYYFVHSYIVEADDPADVAGTTDYGVRFPSIVARGGVWGTQFHPEKSGDAGVALVGEWLRVARAVTAR